MNQHFEDSLEFARQLDREDELAPFRAEFNFPDRRNDSDPVYFCGNSLGLQPKLARTLVEEELDNWARFAVDGHFALQCPQRGNRLGISLIEGGYKRFGVGTDRLLVR